MNRKICLTRFLTLALAILCSLQINAQCLTSWSFKNVNDIPTSCNQSWSENGVTMQMIPTTSATSCGSDTGCDFNIIENAPNQYNYLQIFNGALEVNIPDPSNFYDLRFSINEISGSCQIVRYFDGNTLVLEETVSSNYYQTDPSTTSGLTFDKIQISVITSLLFNFELKYECNDGAPTASTNIGFESLTQGAYGGSGTSGPFLNLQGVDLYVSNEAGGMLPPNAAQYFIEDTRPHVFGHGLNYLWPLHPVKFDFGNIPDDVVTVFFDVATLSLDVVLKINDLDPFIGQLGNAPSNIAPGFTLTEVGSLGNTSGIRFNIEGGAIETLVLGGLEFFMDNLSFVQGQALVCDVSNPTIEILDCGPDQTFSIELDFDHAGNTDSFNVTSSLTDHGNFAYADLPITVSGFPGNGATPYIMQVVDLIDGTCGLGTDVFGPIQCDPFPVCEVFNLVMTDTFCSNGTAYGAIEFEFSNPGSNVWEYWINGEYQMAYAGLGQGNSTIGATLNLTDANPGEINTLQVCVANQNNCCQTIEFETPDCSDQLCLDFGPEAYYGENDGNSPGDTVFLASNDGTVATVENYLYPGFPSNFQRLSIRENGIHNPESINLNLDFSGVNGTVNSVSFRTYFGCCIYFGFNGEYQTLDIIEDLPDALPAGYTSTNINEFWTIEGPDIQHLSFGGGNIEYGDICYTLADSCALSNSSFVVEENCDANGLVSATIDFEHENASDSFNLNLNNIDLGLYAYEDLPLTVNGLDGTNQIDNLINITDQIDPDCQLAIEVGTIDCSFVCGVNEFFVGNQTCNPDGTVNFNLLLIFPNFSLDSFELFLNGTSIGSYETNDNFDYYIENAPITPLEQNLLTACNLSGPECCQTTTFTGMDCFPQVCLLIEPTIEVLDCTNESEYNVIFDFFHTGTTDSFTVDYDGVNYGDFAYIDLPITVGPFQGDGISTYNLLATDLTQMCEIESGVFGEVDCDPCITGSLELLENFCGQIGPFVFFNYNSNGDTGLWTYSLNGIQQDTLTLFPSGSMDELISTDANFQEFNNIIQAWMIDGPDCVATLTFDLNECNNCEINSLEIEVGNCNNDQTFDIEIFLEAAPLSTPYIVTINGENQGQFDYSEFPLTLNGDYGNSLVEVTVQNIANPLCVETTTYQSMDCPAICQLQNPTFTLTDCDPFARFSAVIDFDYGDLTGGFVVYQNGINVGSYEYADLPITRQGFEGDGLTNHSVLIVHDSNPNCTLLIEIGVVDCEVECAILEYFVLNQTCNSDGTTDVTFTMYPVNTNSNSFEVFLNGSSAGTYDVNANYNYTIENLDVIDGQENEWTVCMINGPACCETTTFDGIECSQISCSVEGLTLSEQTCDGIPYGNIFFETSNPGNDFWEWWINGEYQGIEELDASNNYWVELGNANPDILNTLQVCINDQPDCCQTIEFQVLDCTPVCSISQMEVTTNDCNADGTFSISVNFLHENTSDQFGLIGNGQDYGIFNYSDLPVTLSNFEGDASTIYEIIASDIDNNDCASEAIFGPVNCPVANCTIEGLEILSLACSGPELFGEVFFETSNPGNNLAEYWVNGNYQGTFQLNASNEYGLWLNPSNPDIVNTLQICINDQPDCCQTIEFEAPDCSPQCVINGIEYEINDCSADGLFSITIDFFYENTSDQFRLFGNGEDYGIFNYSDLPVTIDGFAGDGGTVYELIVADINNNDCADEIEFGPVNCPIGDCVITGLEIINQFCENNGTIPYANIVFGVENPGNDFWEYFINGESQGTALLNGTNSYDIDISAADPGSVNQLTVCINDQPDCCFTVDLEPINCQPSDCEIEFLELTDLECDGDILFGNLSFEVSNPGNDLFEYWINGTYVGTETLSASNNYVINLEEADPTALNMIEVCINDQPDCCFLYSFQAPDCATSDCTMENLGLSGYDCLQDGTRGVTIFFEHDYPLNEFFEVFIDGEPLGEYRFSSLPLNILHIPPTLSGSAVISVNPVGLPECELMGLVGLAPCPEIYCMDFEQISSDLDLNSDDVTDLPIVLFEQEEVVVTLETCGDPDFFLAQVRINDGCPVVGYNDHALFVQAGLVSYDFNALLTPPNSITFEYCGGGEIILNGGSPIEFGNEVDGQVFSQNGYAVQSWKMSDAPEQGYVTITGADINSLDICGTETTLGPICYEVIDNPSGDDCYGFENLVDGGYFPIGSVEPVIYETSDLKVSLIDDIYDNGFLGVSSTPIAPPFNGAIGNFAVLRGGLEFDFTNLSEPTEFVSFEFSGESFAVSVNNEPEIVIDGFNPSDSLVAVGNGVVMYYSRENSNIWEGEVNFFGNVETLVITSEEIKLDNICYFLEIQGAEVWPGDINSDNIADHCDVIYLGIANGAIGPERASQSEDWNGQFADDWDGAFEFNNTNYKHADANGDGIVDENDLEVLNTNLSKVHGPLPPWNGIIGTELDPPLYVDLNANGPLVSGGAFSAPIILGTQDLPVEDIYGLAFSIVFDTDEMDLSNTSISVNNSWLGNDLWKVEDMDIVGGRINIGMTRTGLIDTTGYGEIGSFTGIIEDLVGKIINIEITDIKALSHDEYVIPIFAQGSSGSVTTNTEKDALEDGLHVFPIPTSNNLHIRNYNEDDLIGIKIYNVLGQTMLLDINPSNINLYNLEEFVSGIYFAEMEFKGTSVVRKIEVLK